MFLPLKDCAVNIKHMHLLNDNGVAIATPLCINSGIQRLLVDI
jgi:hypothetical protein